METQATQLADTRPKLDCPLRVALPVNAPERNATKTKDQFIYHNAFSPNAISVSKKHRISMTKNYSELSFLDTSGEMPQLPGAPVVNMDHDALIKTAIRDFTVLALSSKRAGNKDVEATAYASLGVIYDNQLHYLEGIESYKEYLQICEEIKDITGSAAACNCIGVNYMLMANPPSDSGSLHGISLNEENKKLLEKAVLYHTKHLEIGPDAGGKFVAHTNLGLCLGMMGNINQSAKHHQDALRVAIKMQTLYGQSIAVGNLGMLALVKRDFNTARTCFDQVPFLNSFKFHSVLSLEFTIIFAGISCFILIAPSACSSLDRRGGRNRSVETGTRLNVHAVLSGLLADCLLLFLYVSNDLI
jgi:tetratricopeptide (TPR) repeat protein